VAVRDRLLDGVIDGFGGSLSDSVGVSVGLLEYDCDRDAVAVAGIQSSLRKTVISSHPSRSQVSVVMSVEFTSLPPGKIIDNPKYAFRMGFTVKTRNPYRYPAYKVCGVS
jgi:hypothetical protein